MSGFSCPACGRPAGEFDSRCSGCGALLPDSTTVGAAAPQAAPDGDPLLGATIPPFRILCLLGRGGMGVVYRAVDEELGREVALKFLAPHLSADPRDELRFLQEARAAAALDHPGIGGILQIGRHRGQRFLVLPLYEGETLAARLARADEAGPLPLPEVLALASQLAAALAAAHAAGIVHRDLKPGNVLLTRSGQSKLLDFGLARCAGLPRLTERGTLVGTPAYMAPEQLRGEEVDARTDLWAFGAVLYETLAGRTPFGRSREQPVQGLVHAILTEDPPPLRPLRSATPAALERLVMRCLSRDPARRPAGAEEVLAELREAGLLRGVDVSGSGPAPPPGSGHPAWPRRRLSAAVALALLLPLLLWWAAHRLGWPEPDPPFYVAPLAPVLRGPLDAGSRSLLEANLQTAVLRTLTALEGVAPIDPAQSAEVHGGPREVARAVAAREVLATAAECGEEVCQISLRRLDGRDERVLWTETVRAPLSHPRLLGEAVAAGVRRGYADRRLRFASTDLEIEDETYRRYLDLWQRATTRRSADLLPELAELRRRAPGFLEVYVLESGLCRNLYTRTGDARHLERGLDVARQASERWPHDPRPLFSRFDLELAAGRTAPAEKLLRQLEEEQPGSSAVLLRQALLLERQGDAAKARDTLALAAEIHPSWQTLLVLANTEYRLGHPDEARRRARQLLARHPASLEGAKLLAQIELMTGNPGEVVALLAPRARGSRDEEVLTHLGTAFLLLGRPADAEAAFRRALAARLDHPPALLNLADALELRGRTDEARTLYRRIVAVSGDPGDGTASWPRWSNLAQALSRLGESGRAIAAIQRALRLAPDSHQLAYEAALVYTLLDDRSSARFHAERALAGGVPPVWFRFPWFDPLRQDPSFAARL